ncbi:delta-like protein D [Mercenaria mercenaria]|uniref:delta-like protein D n=1 Tax=Mercenaria mercenaria TaxID=6596 RepID=UPI00234F0D61|nr:delta-like protein D [Mercenaria mercenaria]
MDKYFFRICLIVCLYNTVFYQHVDAFCPAGKTGLSCNKFNYAYTKQANQKENWMSHSAGFAVDNNGTSCTLMDPPVENPWWSVDLTRDMLIDGMDIYIGDETLNLLVSYTVEVQKDGEELWSMCHADSRNVGRFSSPLRVQCNSQIQGRTVRFTAYHQRLSLVLCDVGVYGACADYTYGDYCDKDCGNCNPSDPVCDKTTGHCRTGCDTGWYNLTCDTICPHGKYGDQCSRTCGHCRYNLTCNRFDGDCPNLGECAAGYQSPLCQTECESGKFGLGCLDCGHCKFNQPCNKFNGTCSNRCAPGYQGSICNQTCNDGWYGDECFYECGKCYANSTEPGPCNATTGECPFKCAPGYIEDSYLNSQTQCRTECDEYKWGFNCENTCGNCARLNNSVLISVPCVKSDGSCLTGCMPGWQGLFCTDACSPDTYGISCEKQCGKCKDGVSCDPVHGECPGECEDGYLGNKCQETCKVGFFGYKCQGRCPVNCETNCSFTDGSCICKAGWTGSTCLEVCPPNHYGRNCAFVCGNCKSGTTCYQGDGHCLEGCDPEWTGLKCDAKKIIEVYERSYGDVIGGAIGGAIALGLIIAFIVWVVWRYKQDKSIHFRELASSLRRLSIRGSKSLRRSIQRLSMRGRRNDQQRLGKDAERPATSNGTRGKHPVRRMYDCVKLQSNLIHYDDFSRIYLQLQEATPDGRTLLYDSFQSFLAQRPRDHSAANGNSNNSYYNAAVEPDDVQINVGTPNRIPEFLPLGANLSGFLLVNAPAASEVLWNHLQQRQIETIISIGKEASFSWRPGERITIGHDVVECIDVQLHGSHRETKLTVQRVGTRGRRAIRHLECFFWNSEDKFPLIPTLLMFMERFQQINFSQRERIILVNYLNLHDRAVLFTLVASTLEILIESKRSDVLRTVAIGGNATAKSIRTFEEFKYLHDVIFQYIRSMENRTSSTAI